MIPRLTPHPSNLTPIIPRYARIPDAARLIGVSASTLRAWLRDPKCTITVGRLGTRGHPRLYMKTAFEWADQMILGEGVKLCG